MNVMMLAAGEGTRLRPYTLQKPKPAIPFLNLPLAAHSLSSLKGIKKDKLIVNTYHLPQKIHDLFGELKHGFDKLIFSDETTLLGSGGGVKKVQKELEGSSFVLMNADEVILSQDPDFLKKAIEQHNTQKNIATLIVMKHPEAGGKFGAIWSDNDHNVVTIGKTPAPNTKPWHFIGIQVLSPEVFNFLPDAGESNILYDGVINAFKSGHKAQTYPIDCQWFETGNIHDYWEGSKTCLDILAGANSAPKRHLIETFNQFDNYSDYQVNQNQTGVALIHKDSEIKIQNIEGYVVAAKGSSSTLKKVKDIVVSNNASYDFESDQRIIF